MKIKLGRTPPAAAGSWQVVDREGSVDNGPSAAALSGQLFPGQLFDLDAGAGLLLLPLEPLDEPLEDAADDPDPDEPEPLEDPPESPALAGAFADSFAATLPESVDAAASDFSPPGVGPTAPDRESVR